MSYHLNGLCCSFFVKMLLFPHTSYYSVASSRGHNMTYVCTNSLENPEKAICHGSSQLNPRYTRYFCGILLPDSFQTVIVLTASVKEDERGGQVHASASLLHQSAT
jgi:hypothetical protein